MGYYHCRVNNDIDCLLVISHENTPMLQNMYADLVKESDFLGIIINSQHPLGGSLYLAF